MRTYFMISFVAALAFAAAEDILKAEDVTIIEDAAQFQELYSCLMDTSPCSDKLKIFRDVLPGYLKTDCGGCSANEKALFVKHKNIALEKYPSEMKALEAKYGL